MIRTLSNEEFIVLLCGVIAEVIKTAVADTSKQVIENFSRFEYKTTQAIKQCIARYLELKKYGERNK